MPSAQVTLSERVEGSYVNFDAEDYLVARSTAITFHCTEEIAKRPPGIVHVDGSVRPQVLRESDNPLYCPS